MSEEKKKTFPEVVPYPSEPVVKWFYQSPMIFWRMGLDKLVGQIVLILTTKGRDSGRPRHVALEYQEHDGRMYVMSGYGERSDWMKNIEADPNVTVQTASGIVSAAARRVTEDEELGAAFDAYEDKGREQALELILGYEPTREQFVAAKDSYYLMTFDPTDEPTPPGLEVDLKWLWPVFAVIFVFGWINGFLCRRKKK